MEIILDHEYNGSMVVYSEAEAAEWGKKGWLKRPSKNTPAKALPPEESDETEGAEVLTAPKKPGRKPKA